MADIGLSAFSIFFMGSPSFLGHQRALAEGHGRSNCETLFGMSAIPSDNYIRTMLDGAAAAAFDGLFIKAIEAAGPLTPFQCLDGRVAIALDGTEHFCSRKIKCEQCSTRRRSDGGTEYFHAFLGASLVAPGHRQVLPLPPEFIAPQDGAEKQDCERNAAKRWLTGTAAASLTCGRSFSVTICLPASRSLPRSSMPAAASSSPASRLRTRPSLSTCMAPNCKNIGEPSANAASTLPPSTAGSTLCRCAPPATPSWSTGSPSRPSTPKASALTTTASLRILRSRPTPSPNWPPAAAPVGRSKTRPSTCSRPTVTISNTTLGTARKPSPAS